MENKKENVMKMTDDILECLPGGFFTYYADGAEEIITFNKEVLKIYGCDTGEEFRTLTGNSFKGMVHPDDLELVESNIALQIQKQNDLDYVEYRIVCRDGSEKYVRDYGRFVHSRDYGDIYCVFIHDITQNKIIYERKMNQYTLLIATLSSIYSELYYIDFEENSFQEIISADSVHYAYGEKTDAENSLKRMVQNRVADEYSAIMYNFMDLNTINERMIGEKIIVQDYLEKTGEWIRGGFITMERNAIGEVKKVIYATRCITSQKEMLETQDNLIQALSIPYENIYKINTDTGEAVCIRMGSDMKERYGQKFAAGNYERSICIYIENDVFKEDRYLFRQISTVSGVNELLKDKKTYEFTYRVFRNQQLRYFQCQLVKPNSKRNDVVLAFKNVDEEMRRQLKQTKEMEMQREIIEGLGSEYYSVLLVNPNKDKVTIYREEEEEGRVIAEYVRRHDNCWSMVLHSYSEEMVTDASRSELTRKLSLDYIRVNDREYSFTYEKRAGDGIIYLQARVSYVSEKDGGLVAVIGTRNVDDLIRKERRQEMALRAAFDAAEAASKAKTDFLSHMSHDIRTPMNGIIGMTAIAATHVDDRERVQDCLKKINLASKHLLSLINEVLDMSKIESGKVNLVEEEFNHSDLIDSLISMTGPQIAEHHHELSVNISGVTHEAVMGDSLRIQKVFTNLMSNAVKYTPDGGKIQLSISEIPSLHEKVGCYEVVFEDNGIGMSEEFMEQIFEPFTRSNDDSYVNKVQGTGLGMAISRNIVRMMSGDIKVESRLGVGSRFTVTMYLKLQDTATVHSDKFVDLDVLVADDDEISLESCCGMLNDLGMRAEGVSTGVEMVEKVVARHQINTDYFACIIDWKMPDMDGIATTRAIRQAVGKDVPIIIISAYDWSDIEQEARTAGANAFISKPLFQSRLVKTFSSLMGIDELGGEQEAPLIALETIDLTGCRVLLAEDNELNAEIAKEILERTGLTVERAADGIEAADKMDKCEDGYYDMIFMDIQMPRMNGYDATRAIRAMDRNYCRQIPIIAMTADAFAEDVHAAKTAGMNEHIAKPLDLNKLAKILNKWIQKKGVNVITG